MHEADRKRFTAGIEELCVVLPDRRPTAEELPRLTAAYWKALAKMDIGVFERVVEHANETLDRFPRPATLWKLSREVRRSMPVRPEKPPFGDALHGWANRVMFQWLYGQVRRGNRLPDELLQSVIDVKNDELAMYRMLLEDQDPEATPARFIGRFEQRANAIADTRLAA